MASEMEKQPIIECDNLVKIYKTKDIEVLALQGLELQIDKGELMAIVGNSGSGKSTFLNMIGGLDRPSAGRLIVDGKDLFKLSEKELVEYKRSTVGFVWQNNARNLLPYLTALQNVQVPMMFDSVAKKEQRALELLELVGLAGEKHRIRGFSRGMKQRLGIAQALLNRPKLLICDEPTSALDPVGRKEILDILLAVREQTTVLLSTHILSDVERICTDVAFLDNGVAGLQGPLSQIRAKYRSEAYLLETEREEDTAALLEAFSDTEKIGGNRLTFYEKQNTLHDVLGFAAQRKLSLVKLERAEPSLESLFMEVTGK